MTPNARATRWVALFCLSFTTLSCRQGDDPPVAPEAISFHLSFSPGDTYQYDAWLIDPFGYSLPSTFTHAVQRVLSTGGSTSGLTGVTKIRDSTTALRDTSAIVQEFSVGQSAEGDLYRLGFLAEIARIKKLPIPPARWDRLAAFSAGLGQSWVVGYLDSAQQNTVYGEFAGVTDLYSVKVNGVLSVFPAYRINITGVGVDYSFWVSDSPSGFLRYLIEPGDTTNGAQFELTSMQRKTQ
jgi:hypothetical protein